MPDSGLAGTQLVCGSAARPTAGDLRQPARVGGACGRAARGAPPAADARAAFFLLFFATASLLAAVPASLEARS